MIGGAVKRVRCKEEFHALDISGGCAVALIHVTATDPFCARRHTNLVTHAVIADGCAGGMAAMEEIVARLLRIVAARVTNAIVNGIVPVVIVIGVHPIPAAIVRLKRVMGPALASVGAGNNNVLAGKPKRPDLWRVRVLDSGFDGSRSVTVSRSFNGTRSRQVVMDNRIAGDARDVRTGR